MDAVETGRRIVGEGSTTEEEWVDWFALLRPPPITLHELLPADARLVVVSPHPDDEVLACGGLLALHAQRQGSIAIVAVTDGEASHLDDPAWSSARLALARRTEREAGLAQLGVAAGSVIRLALPDSQVRTRIADLTRCLRQILRPTDCVVGTWQFDGHPDHDAVGAAAAGVCAERGCRLLEAPVWMWHWGEPADARVPWQRLRALPLSPRARALKAAALAEHCTQLAPRGPDSPVLGHAILARAARKYEYFFV